MERVNNIFLRIDKKVIIAAGAVFLTLLIGFSFLKITVNIIFPGNDLGIMIKESFKELFGKAVKFDTFFFRFNGDIVLQNFYLSNTTDFNDNINLIKCEQIIIDTDIIDLLRKKISISEVYMSDPEITIVKNYGKTYYEVLSEYFITGLNKDRMSSVFKDGLKIKISNASGIYREVFRDGKTNLELDDLDINVKYRDSMLEYSISGDIRKKNEKFGSGCSFSFSGELNTETLKSENSVILSDFDVKNLSEFLREKNINQFIFNGDLSADIDVSCENGITRFNGNVEIDDLECRYVIENDNVVICHDEDFDADFNFYLSGDMGKIKVEKLRAGDGIFEIRSTMEYKKDETLSISINSNRINLKKLSERITPFKNSRYSGYLNFNTDLIYRFTEERPEVISINASLEQFNLLPQNKQNNEQQLISDCNSQFKLARDSIEFKINLNTGKSDINFNLNTNLKDWAPFTSDTSITINSDKLEGRLLSGGVIAVIKYFYNEAYIDMFQNFDEQRNFLKEPEGIFISNNNISLKIQAKSLIIAGDACLNNLYLDLSLDKGMLRTTAFNLEGYSGTYSMNFYGSLKQEYPFIRFEGYAKEIDLASLSDNAALQYSLAGKLSFDYKFETNAYRIGQIIENGNASMNVSITSGRFANHDIQKNLQNNIQLNGYNCDSLTDISFDSFTIGFMQSGDQFYFKNLSMSGSSVAFSGYGRYYSEGDGINLPLTMTISSADETTRVPLMIYGNLMTPCIKVNTKTARESACF